MDAAGASPPSNSGRARRDAPGPPTARSARGSLPAVVVIEGPLKRTDIAGLCNRLGRLIERGRPTTVVCDVGALTEPDLVTVDALARLQLPRFAWGAGCGCVTPATSCKPSWPCWGCRTSCRCGRTHGSRWSGSPNSGKRRAVSRKELSAVIRPPEISSTCSAHGSCRPPGLGWYWRERRRAVGRRSGPAGSPRSRCPGRAATRGCRRGPRSHSVVRRHRQRRVLVQQRVERVHVVALEGVDVARQQLALRRRPAGSTASVAPGRWLGQRGPGPLERAVDRGDRGVEQLGDLVRLPAQHLAQDQHRALPRRQVLQRGDERQPDRLPGDRDLGRVAGRRAAPAVGHRLDPRRPRAAAARAATSAVAAGPQVHRPGAALRAVEHVEADVGGDAVQPGAQRGAALEPVEARARPGPSSPARRPRPRTPSRASGSSSRSARPGAVPAAVPAPPDCPRRCRGPGRLLPRCCVSYRLVPLRQRIPRHSATS